MILNDKLVVDETGTNTDGWIADLVFFAIKYNTFNTLS